MQGELKKLKWAVNQSRPRGCEDDAPEILDWRLLVHTEQHGCEGFIEAMPSKITAYESL